MRKGSLASLVLGMVFAATAATAGAVTQTRSDGLEVTPATAIRGTAPGRLVEETVTVVNLSREDFSVTAKLADARVDQRGRFSSVDPGSGLPSAAAWGTLQPASFMLPAGHTQNVVVSFTPPKGTAGGGYYATLDLSGLSGSGASATATHAVLLEVAGNGLIRAPSIAKISAPAIALGSTIPVTMRLSNTGNDYAVAEGQITVRDMFSNKASTVEIPRTPIVPGTPRILTVNVPTPVMPGRVRVSAHLSFGLGVPQDTATATTYATGWWQLGVAIALLLLLLRLVVAIVRWRRRRRARKSERRAAEHETRTPVPAGANGGGFADYEPLENAPTDRASAAPVAVEPATFAPAAAEPIAAERPPAGRAAFAPSQEDEDLWPAPVVVSRAPKPPAKERPRPRLVFSRPADDPFDELAKLSDRDDEVDDREPEIEDTPGASEEAGTGYLAAVEAALAKEPDEEPQPEEATAAEPEPEPEPAPVPAPAPEPVLTIVRPLPVEEVEAPIMPIAAGDSTRMAGRSAAAPAVAAAPSVAPAAPEEEPRSGERTARLSEQLLSSIDAAPASGREAAQRRARVAIEMLTAGTGKSAEQVQVALKVLRSSGADASAVLSEALDAEMDAGRESSFAPIALALHEVAGGRAVEALLRAYAVAKRGQIVALRTALKTYDAGALGEQEDLLEALPADRRAALKPSKR